ncbi:ATP-binding protein [Halalkalibacter kiskunsagensis]|uniref:histidine kinase n=1 Tax=Halalkalibacter kiskunsagensis TaxID=1548599 RepID=A0ABV6KEB8_9BACI
MKLTIGKKLLLSFLVLALFFGGTSMAFYYYIDKINHSYSSLIDLRVHILSNTKEIQVLTLEQTNGLRGYLLTESPHFISELRTANDKVNDVITETRTMVTQPESKKDVDELYALNEEFEGKYEELITLYDENQNQQEALDFFMTEVLPIGSKLAPLANLLTERNQHLMDEARAENTALVQDIYRMTIILSISSLILFITIGFAISQNITINLSKIMNVIASFTTTSNNTEDIPKIEVTSQDETGDIAKAFNKMTLTLKEKSWLEHSIAEVATMYQGIHDLETLAEQFMMKITPMVGASYGVFYVKQGSGENESFQSLAFSGKSPTQTHPTRFRYNEGLIGQAALEKRTILLTNLPEDYVQVTSGVGAAKPVSLIIIPVEFEGTVTVVIELASFYRFTQIQETLLTQIASQIGITVNSVKGRMQVENLLQQSKLFTEELQSQSEELQMQQEELLSMNEKLEEQFHQSEQKTQELSKTKQKLEKQAEQLELNSKYKSEFLANMSHELRSPLNSLLILAHLLTENKEGNLTEKQVEYADTISRSGKDLLQLINDILDLAKIESGKMTTTPTEVNVKELCIFVERQFSTLALEKDLAFNVQLSNNLPTKLWTDGHRLQQILTNLLSNAFKFTEEGEVMFHAQIAKLPNHLSTKNSGSILLFTVKDTGIGIPKAKHQLIFQAFQQGDGTTNRKYGGTGLGLSISQEIAELLGGRIEVESKVGEGSTFTFHLPMDESNIETDPTFLINDVAATVDVSDETDDQTPFLKGKTILIVDDDMRNIFALTTALEDKGTDTLFAENGEEGLRLLRKHPEIDLILMDIMMPRMDGYETIQMIRSMPKYQTLPIIALTAKAMKDDKDKCMKAGASDYISKPVFLDQLFSLLQVWLCK